MKYTQGIIALVILLAASFGAYWLVTRPITKPSADKPTPPANVAKIAKEDELNTIVLTAEAEQRIGLQTAAIAKKNVPQTRLYGGEVMVPVGHTIIVAAPLSGTLKPLPTGLPKVGTSVKAGQTLLQLAPLFTPDSRVTLTASLVDAEGQVKNAKAQSDNARIALDRAKRVLKEGAGSQRQVDDAQAAFDVAQQTLDAATARQTILKKVLGDVDQGTTVPINIDAPHAGVLRTVTALPGQTVPSGAPLFEVLDLTSVWVRVAIPVSDIDDLNRTASANIGKLGPTEAPRTTANPVAAPPSANALAGTIDLYYELPNPSLQYSPGQRLGVSLPLTTSGESLVVPWSAIVFDINGGTWVYESIAPRTYARKRVQVLASVGPLAVLRSGPKEGTTIVTAGVQELFGAETGFVK